MSFRLHLPARMAGAQAHLILQVPSPREDYLREIAAVQCSASTFF
jgi:hypothetical protein